MTLTTVLKFANKYQLTTCVESLADAAGSYLTVGLDVITCADHKFLLIANILPLVPKHRQVALLEFLHKTEQLNALITLKSGTLTAIANSIYKTKQQKNISERNKTNITKLVDTGLLQKLEQAWLKQFDGKNEDLLAIYSYSMASLGYSGETKQFTVKFLENNTGEMTLINIAFFGETLKKLKSLNKGFICRLEKGISADNAIITPELALQLLRVHQKELTMNAESARKLIKIMDDAFYMRKFNPAETHVAMIVQTLGKYAYAVDLSTLPVYQTLIGSKTIF